MKGKIVWAGEWVWVRPWLNKCFRTEGKCRTCSRMSCAPGWLSIKTREFRCARCFDAEALDARMLDVLEGFEPATDETARAVAAWHSWG